MPVDIAVEPSVVRTVIPYIGWESLLERKMTCFLDGALTVGNKDRMP
jgi:hypothetical protein